VWLDLPLAPANVGDADDKNVTAASRRRLAAHFTIALGGKKGGGASEWRGV
jgi:hypothetical protein